MYHGSDINLALPILLQASQSPKKAIATIRKVILAYLFKVDSKTSEKFKKELREDWRFFLLMSTILTDVAMTAVQKGESVANDFVVHQLFFMCTLKGCLVLPV